MENFITGIPGCEHQHRAAMLHCLGKEKYEYFFNKFLEYFFTESDAAFFASLGLNCIRVPFNYRHFEDDMNPRILKPDGFKWLDRVIDMVPIVEAQLTNLVCSSQHIHHPRSSCPSRWAGTDPKFLLIARTQIGTATMLVISQCFGNTKIFKTERSGCGRKLR